MEHLALEVFDLTADNNGEHGSKFANLPEDTTITITDTSEIFASGDVWSFSFTLNVRANAHIFGTSGDMHGSRLHDQIHKRRVRLWVEGVALYLGYLMLGDESDVDKEGNVDVTFESGQKTFEQMIDGAKANQVPMMDKVMVGVALWTKRKVELEEIVRISARVDTETSIPPEKIIQKVLYWPINADITFRHSADGEKEGEVAQEYPRMVFPKGVFRNVDTGIEESIDKLNTDTPYTESSEGVPTVPYCNIALCYQKYGYTKKDEYGYLRQYYNEEPEAQRGYEYMPANRVNSAPNFYVIYWIRALMKHLGIHVEENQMMDVEDLRRLFFVNTNCAYQMPNVIRGENPDSGFTRYKFAENKRYIAETEITGQNAADVITVQFDDVELGDPTVTSTDGLIGNPSISEPRIEGRSSISIMDTYESDNGYLHDAYASSECFPNADISEVIKAIENGFGVRFLFSDSYKRVRIVLLRNVFKSKDIQEISCDVLETTKTENNIRGFRLTYGNTEDTSFYYKGFADKLPHKKPYFVDDSDKHDYSQWDTNAEYQKIINKISAFDKTCYVTPNNGNAYGIKIDKDAKRYKDLHPSLFEFAGFMDAEDGDCSGDEGTIHEISMGFTPAIMNDLNLEEERNGESKQRFALFLDEKMRPRRPDLEDLTPPQSYNDSDAVYSVEEMYTKYGPGGTGENMSDGGIVKPGEFAIHSDACFEHHENMNLETGWMFVEYIDDGGVYKTTYAMVRYPLVCDFSGAALEGYRLYLQDNFEPNDNGISPIETHEWGLTLGIMRGSGSDARVDYEEDDDDHEDNQTWSIIPGSSATTHPDTCDSYGNEWDYNGSSVVTQQTAQSAFTQLFPNSNATFQDVKTYNANIFYLQNKNGKVYRTLMVTSYYEIGPSARYRFLEYVDYLSGHTDEEIMQLDALGIYDFRNTIVELDSSFERCDTCNDLVLVARGIMNFITIDDNGVGTRYGRLSLKLRAEKPNPFFNPTLPDIIESKEQAGTAMLKLYTTANTALLNRPVVSNATMRAAGWDCPGDGYATVYSIGYGIEYRNGKVHELLWTPIKEDGTVLTERQLQNYIGSFNGLPESSIIPHDTQHLILDIDTTEDRANVLHELQAIYYASQIGPAQAANISSVNPRYLEITDENLRNRGLCDTLYKEYSYWIRNARISTKTVRMELAQLLSIDKTKKVRVGDITGFIKKMQYSVSKQTGIGNVTIEIMYI